MPNLRLELLIHTLVDFSGETGQDEGKRYSTRGLDRNVNVYGSRDGKNWPKLLTWRKDRWPMGLFQYGNAFFPPEKTKAIF